MTAHNFKDLEGHRFGRLLVVGLAEPHVGLNKKKYTRWECQCDCGTKREVLGCHLRRGLTESCGCLRRELASARARIDPQENAWNDYIQAYKRGAQKRGHDWNLPRELVQMLAVQDCAYCGTPPRRNEAGMRRYLDGARRQGFSGDMQFAEAKVIYTNGLDRIDNARGYVSTNVVPCCPICNSAKNDMPADEWQAYLARLTSHRLNAELSALHDECSAAI